MKNVIFRILAVGLLFSFAVPSFAQEKQDSTPKERTLIIVKLADGSEVRGYFIKRDLDHLTIETTSLGIVKILNANIIKITTQDGTVKESKETKEKGKTSNTDWFENPNPSRYLFGPSSIPLEKGEVYLHAAYILLGGVQYGVSDNFSMGIGTAITTLFGSPFLSLTPKYTFYNRDKLSFSAGGLLFFISDNWSDGNWNSSGIVYGTGTYGTKEDNISIGLGFGYFKNELAEKPIITFSGMTRVHRRVSLISENWIIPDVINDGPNFYGVFSYGVRFLSEGFSMDLSFLNNRDIANVSPIGIPYIGVMVKF